MLAAQEAGDSMAFQDSRPGDIRATLAVSQEEARFGGKRVINLPGGRSVTVTVPAGIRDGEEIRLAGQGAPNSPDGAPGDLILRVSVIATPLAGDEAPDGLTEIIPEKALPPLAQKRLEAAGGVGYPPGAETQPAPSTSTPTRAANGGYTPAFPAYPPVQSGPQSYPGSGSYPNYPAYDVAPPLARGYAQPSYAPPPTPQPQPKRSGAATVIILLLVFALVAGSGLFFYFGYYQPTQAHHDATATAQAQVAGTANTQASSTAQVAQATAQAAATGTVQAQATAQAYQRTYTQATSGTPVLNDALNAQSGSQWDETSGASGSCAFSGGSYHSSISTATLFQPCYAESTNYSNFAFQVDMTITKGDEGGIIFRADSVNDKFYLFRLNADGSYNLYLYVSSRGSDARLLLGGSTKLMKPVGQSNEITLIAQGTSLLFYLNQQYLDSTADATYSSGKIGVFGESSTQPTDVAFSNAKVWTL